MPNEAHSNSFRKIFALWNCLQNLLRKCSKVGFNKNFWNKKLNRAGLFESSPLVCTFNLLCMVIYWITPFIHESNTRQNVISNRSQFVRLKFQNEVGPLRNPLFRNKKKNTTDQKKKKIFLTYPIRKKGGFVSYIQNIFIAWNPVG